MPKHKLIRLAEFEEDITQHVNFLAKVSTKAALKLIDDIEKELFALPNAPFANKIIFETVRRIVLDKRYAILYEVEGQNIKILAMYDCRMEEYADLLL